MARRVWEKLCFEYTFVNLYSFIPKLVTKPEYMALALSVWGLWGGPGRDKYKRHCSWLQFSKWASLIAQKVKNLPTMWETIGEGNGYPLQHSSLENSMNRGAWRATVHGVAKSQTWLSDRAGTQRAGTRAYTPAPVLLILLHRWQMFV